MKLHRDLKVRQKTVWFMVHRIRQACEQEGGLFAGPVEVDETYWAARRRMDGDKWLRAGRGAVRKTAVVGMKDRENNHVSAKVVENTYGLTLKEFVLDQVEPGAKVYTDDHRSYVGLPKHQSVNHSVGKYAEGWRIRRESSPMEPC